MMEYNVLCENESMLVSQVEAVLSHSAYFLNLALGLFLKDINVCCNAYLIHILANATAPVSRRGGQPIRGE